MSSEGIPSDSVSIRCVGMASSLSVLSIQVGAMTVLVPPGSVVDPGTVSTTHVIVMILGGEIHSICPKKTIT